MEGDVQLEWGNAFLERFLSVMVLNIWGSIDGFLSTGVRMLSS